MAGKFLAGISVGFFSIICPLYVGEIAPMKIRGTLLGSFQTMLNFGVFFIMSLGYFVSMATLNIVCTVIPIMFAITFYFLPESPAMLHYRNRENEEINVMKSLRKNSESDGLQNEITISRNEKTFVEVLKVKSSRKAFIIILLIFFFFQMSGINIVLFYSTTIFKASGVEMDPGISSIIIGLIGFLSAFAGSFFIDRFGRRILIIGAYGLVLLSLCGIGCFFILQDFKIINSESLQWLPLASLALFISAFNFGVSPTSFALYGEIFADQAKKFLAPICQTLNWFFTFLVGATFPLLISSIGMGLTFIIFIVSTFFALLFALFFVPETKGKTQAEIIEMLS